MTQVQLAQQVGVSSRSIIAIEKGEQSSCLLLSYKIAKVLGASLEEIFMLNENLMEYEKVHCEG